MYNFYYCSCCYYYCYYYTALIFFIVPSISWHSLCSFASTYCTNRLRSDSVSEPHLLGPGAGCQTTSCIFFFPLIPQLCACCVCRRPHFYFATGTFATWHSEEANCSHVLDLMGVVAPSHCQHYVVLWIRCWDRADHGGKLYSKFCAKSGCSLILVIHKTPFPKQTLARLEQLNKAPVRTHQARAFFHTCEQTMRPFSLTNSFSFKIVCIWRK